jgi:hypothetical protein
MSGCLHDLGELFASNAVKWEPGRAGKKRSVFWRHILSELVALILEVAQVHEDTDEQGMVYMPDEEEWGLIVGLARKYAKGLTVREQLNEMFGKETIDRAISGADAGKQE